MTKQPGQSSSSSAETITALLLSSAVTSAITAGAAVGASWFGAARHSSPAVSIYACAVVADGTQAVAMCWRIRSNRKGMQHATVRSLRACRDSIRAAAVDPCGERLAFLTATGRLQLCAQSDGRLLWSHNAHGLRSLPLAQRPTLPCRLLRFSPDGLDLVTAAYEQGWILAAWDARSGNRMHTLRGHDAQINGATYLPDGTLLSWGGDGTLRLWDVARGFARRVITLREIFSC